MALFHAREEMGLKKTGVTVRVPDHPKARLMYYLSCVGTVLELDGSSRLMDYINHHSLTDEETRALLLLAIIVSPDELIGKVFFHSEELCGDSTNEFYEISKVTHLLAVTDSVLVGGKTQNITKIMTFKMEWLQKNYLIPIKAFEYQIRALANDINDDDDNEGSSTVPTRRAIAYPSQTSSSKSGGCCCNIL